MKNKFEVSFWQFLSTNSRWCIINIGCLNKFSNCLSKKYRCSIVSSEIFTKTIRILTLNFYRQLIEIASLYSNCQRARRAKPRAWRGGSIIEPMHV